MLNNTDPINLIIILSIFSFIPIFVVMTTSFIKVAMVLTMTRESLGVQQIPPNIIIYGLSLILSFYIMGPVYNNSYQELTKMVNESTPISASQIISIYNVSSSPLKKFMFKHSSREDQLFFYNKLDKFWGPELMRSVKRDDLIILVPSFVVNELNQAFKIGFLIYLPSIIIDIIISNILMAMGMMMMSPAIISLPIKLLLFISLGGWINLINALMNSY